MYPTLCASMKFTSSRRNFLEALFNFLFYLSRIQDAEVSDTTNDD